MYIHNMNRYPSLGHTLTWGYISGSGVGTYSNNTNKNDGNKRTRTNTVMVLSHYYN